MTFTPERSDAIRAGLIAAAASKAPRRRRVLAGAGLVLAGALLGVGGSVAAAATGAWAPVAAPPSPAPVRPGAVDAPAGHIPGQPILTLLGEPTGQRVTGDAELPLTDRPGAATHVRMTITCLTAGTFFWGTDAGGNNPSLLCDAGDSGATAWYDFPLDVTATALYVTMPEDAEAVVTFQYLTQVPTNFGVNQNGQTYGSGISDQGTPDLVFVTGVAPDGSSIEGYARAVDLSAFSPDRPGLPGNPEEALRWQQEREERYPDGWEIPVFASDGVTQLGVFHVG